MTTRTVTDPRSVTWRVRRRWIPHSEGRGVRARLARIRRDRAARKQAKKDKKDKLEWVELADVGEFGDSIAAVLIGIAVVVVVVLLIAFGPGLVLIGVDLAWLVAVFVVGLFARVVLRRPWLVEATSASGERRQWGVSGFRAAGRARDEIAGDLAAGLQPLGDEV